MKDGAYMLFSGDKALKQILDDLPDRTYKRVIAFATRRAVAPWLAAARRLVPVETGLLKKSLGIRARAYTASQTHIAIVGARRGYKTLVQAVGSKIDAGKGRKAKTTTRKFRDPARYAHIVELLHKPFLRPAFDQNREAVLTRMKTSLAQGIVREAKRLARRRIGRST